MAYLYVNTDGVTRPYSTIADAQADANTGDTVVLDPGTYAETVDLGIKFVNIRGNTNTPENDDVIIDPYPTRRWPSVKLSSALTSSGTVYIEGVTLKNRLTTANYQGVLDINSQSASKYLSVIFNRCRFVIHGAHYKRQVHLGSTYFNKLWFYHCEWSETGTGTASEYKSVNWDHMNDSRVIACVYDGAYGCDGCVGNPDIHNYVSATASGYGPSYSSDWYVSLPEPVGYFDGYVMEEGSPVQRTINLHKRDTGKIVNTTISNPAGYYYVDTTSSGMHYIVCLDAPANPLYNDLIIGSAYPTAI